MNYLYHFNESDYIGMPLAPGQQLDLLGAVDPPGDDLDGELLAGFFQGTSPADWEAAVAQNILLQGQIVASEEQGVLEQKMGQVSGFVKEKLSLGLRRFLVRT